MFSSIFLRLSTDKCTILYTTWCIKSYDCFYIKIGMKKKKTEKRTICKNLRQRNHNELFPQICCWFSRRYTIWTEIFFEISFFSPKIRSSKMKYSSSQKSSVSFLSIFFHRDFPIFRFRNNWPTVTENIYMSYFCCSA